MKYKDIVVVGSLAYDHIFPFKGHFKEFIFPEDIHNLSVCFTTDEKSMHFGGCGGNIAYNLKLLDEDCKLMATIGKDYKHYFEWLDKYGINRDFVEISEKYFSPSAYITSDTNDNQVTTFYSGSLNDDLSHTLDKMELEKPLAIFSPYVKNRTYRDCLLANKLGIPFILDLGQKIGAFLPDQLTEMIKGAEVLILNRYEYLQFKKATKMSKTDILEFVNIVIETKGPDGSIITTKDNEIEIQAVISDKAVDATGCGDAYRAALIKGLKMDLDLETIGKHAALAATYVVECKGTQQHNYTLDEFRSRYFDIFAEECMF